MRISRDEMLMKMAEVVAQRGTCSRLRVGAIASLDGRVMCTGYNGAPSGLPHCNHSQTDTRCETAVHAEANAIAFAARYGARIEGAELHVTDSPCQACAFLIINSGIRRVVYRRMYRNTAPLAFLLDAGISCVQL
jgi:dCMP deaminase